MLRLRVYLLPSEGHKVPIHFCELNTHCVPGARKTPSEQGQHMVSVRGPMGSIPSSAEPVALLSSASGVRAATGDS